MTEFMNEDDIWQEYKRTSSMDARNKIIEYYLPLVRIVAGRLSMNLPTYVDREDCVSSGMMGLLRAVSAFDPQRGIKFETYATHRIRGAILDDLRKQDWMPVSVRQKAKQYQAAMQRIEGRMGRSATDKEIADELAVPEEQLKQMLSEIQVTTMLPLEDFYQSDGTGLKPAEDFAGEFEQAEIKQVLAQALDRLPEKERVVLSLYYYEELTLKEISKVMSLSEARISQMHTKGIYRLKTALANMREILL